MNKSRFLIGEAVVTMTSVSDGGGWEVGPGM